MFCLLSLSRRKLTTPWHRHLRRTSHLNRPCRRGHRQPNHRPHACLPFDHQAPRPCHCHHVPRIHLGATNSCSCCAVRHCLLARRSILRTCPRRARIPRRNHLACIARSRKHDMLGWRTGAGWDFHCHHGCAEGWYLWECGRDAGLRAWEQAAWQHVQGIGIRGGHRVCDRATAHAIGREEVWLCRRSCQRASAGGRGGEECDTRHSTSSSAE